MLQLNKALISAPSSSRLQQCRFLRERWMRPFLKDLYHRRLVIGADPAIHRSAYPNWNYESELSAFSHRIGASEVSSDTFKRALTTEKFLERNDVQADAKRIAPSDDAHPLQHNSELVQNGRSLWTADLQAYLRYHLPHAPENVIESVRDHLLSTQLLSQIAGLIGLSELVRSYEFPPSNSTLSDSLCSLAAVLSPERRRAFLLDFIIPQIIDIDFMEIFPLNDPYGVLVDLHKKNGAQSVEARLLRSAGEHSTNPIYVVGIYKDETEIVGQNVGEQLDVAVEMAARDGLLRLWGITPQLNFFFGDHAKDLKFEEYAKANARLEELCSEGVDTSVADAFKEYVPNVVEMAIKYKKDVFPVVGPTYTKRLRHKFSRGSLAKRSFRYLVKPKVYTIA